MRSSHRIRKYDQQNNLNLPNESGPMSLSYPNPSPNPKSQSQSQLQIPISFSLRVLSFSLHRAEREAGEGNEDAEPPRTHVQPRVRLAHQDYTNPRVQRAS